MNEQSLAELNNRIAALEAENSELRHQHGNDQAANKMLIYAHDGQQKIAGELKQQNAELIDRNNQIMTTFKEFLIEIEKCSNIAQLLDSMNPTASGAFTGTPSERITRQLKLSNILGE